ncbi:MAG: NAD(P)H-dependent oxidoreductase subunit E [Actinomycetota bacterium]|nr:NAD(P)H-dependent oxidoreductase subunit E [Actinomycetota bacterium]
MRQLGHRPDALIEVLHAAQEAFGYLDTDMLAFISASLGVPLSKCYGVVTFYSHFTLRSHGEHTCVVCTGTACHISGGAGVLASGRWCHDHGAHPHHRWRRGGRRRRPDRAAGRQGARHRHPHAVSPRRAQRRRRLPAVPR